jgi:hypothetical protein
MKLPPLIRKFVDHVRFMNNIFKTDMESAKRSRTSNEGLSPSEIELKVNGITVIPDFMPSDTATKYCGLLENFIRNYSTSTKLENGTYIGFRTEVSNDRADQGMIDISNVDNSIKEIEPLLFAGEIEKIISKAVKGKVSFYRLNAYINVGVTNTRDYHVDSFSKNYKAFIYLTDVTDNSFGPYSYILGSNRFTWVKYLNIYRNSILSHKYRVPDMPKFYSKSKVFNAIGKKGSLVISDQFGIHRGIAQEPGKKRVALIFNFNVTFE